MVPFARLAIAAALFATPVAAQTATAAFTDSNVEGLATTKRVAITSVIVSFQASIAATKQGGSGMFADKTSAKTVLANPDMDPGLQDAIAQAAYERLRTDLSAAGYEVVPESQIKASATYGRILATAGTPNHTRFANALGDVMLVSPPSLSPYLPYSVEGSLFVNPTSHIGWAKGFGGGSITPGGPSTMTMGKNWTLPGMEVALAKELNAHLVKATYVVTLGQASASRKRTRLATTDSAGREEGQGSAAVEIGLLADQTRIAFRAPNGNAKWQKVSMMKIAPAKDGDVVVHLATSLAGDGDDFAVSGSSSQGGLFNPGADFQFAFTVTLTHPTHYSQEVNAMIADANRAMVGLVRH